MRIPSISRGIKRGPIHRLDNFDIQRTSVKLKIPPYLLFPPHFSREFTHILSEEDSALSLIDHFPLADAWPLLSESVKHHPLIPLIREKHKGFGEPTSSRTIKGGFSILARHPYASIFKGPRCLREFSAQLSALPGLAVFAEAVENPQKIPAFLIQPSHMQRGNTAGKPR